MNYKNALNTLNEMLALVNKTARDGWSREDHDNLASLYGEVEDVIHKIEGKSKIEVEIHGRTKPIIYSNFIEAGYLSGRTFHTHQGRNQLLKVIGKVKRLIENPETSQSLKNELKNSEEKATGIFNNKVFVVHGHDDTAKTELEIFLGEIGLEPIVLHRQADEGQTIIEKFEKHADVGYAFILLTPDEVTYLRDQESLSDNERKKEFRARPNVIFEFGYFVGRLGRSRVCCLHTGDVVLPTDISGMVYKSYTKNIEEIAYAISKDLKAAGYKLT